MAVLIAIFALLLISLLGLSVAFNGMLEVMSSSNYQHAVMAFYLADAGINHAFQEITQYPIAFSALLKGPDDLDNTDDDGCLTFNTIPPEERIPPTGFPFGSGRYSVRFMDDIEPDNNPLVDSNQRILLISQGFGPDGSTAKLEAMITLGGNGIPAIICGESLEISGNPVVQSPWGGVHANDDLRISGNPAITGSATCSDVFSTSGNPTITGDSGGNRPPIPVPEVHAQDHRDIADYILGSDGIVTTFQDGQEVFAADCADGRTSFRGWKFRAGSPAEWTSSTNQNDYFPGTYYVEGDATLSGHIGSSSITVSVSIIAEGSIRASGSAHARPAHDDIFLLANGDILITGNLQQTDQNYSGTIAAHEQIKTVGTSSFIIGHIIAEDAAHDSTLVTENDIGGNITVIANSAFTSLGPATTPQIASWREIN